MFQPLQDVGHGVTDRLGFTQSFIALGFRKTSDRFQESGEQLCRSDRKLAGAVRWFKFFGADRRQPLGQCLAHSRQVTWLLNHKSIGRAIEEVAFTEHLQHWFVGRSTLSLPSRRRVGLAGTHRLGKLARLKLGWLVQVDQAASASTLKT